MSDYMRRKGGDFNVNLGASLPASVVDEMEFLAQSRGLKKARVLRELALRGLAAYHRDGRLSEASDSTGGVTGISSVNKLDLAGEAR